VSCRCRITRTVLSSMSSWTHQRRWRTNWYWQAVPDGGRSSRESSPTDVGLTGPRNNKSSERWRASMSCANLHRWDPVNSAVGMQATADIVDVCLLTKSEGRLQLIHLLVTSALTSKYLWDIVTGAVDVNLFDGHLSSSVLVITHEHLAKPTGTESTTSFPAPWCPTTYTQTCI